MDGLFDTLRNLGSTRLLAMVTVVALLVGFFAFLTSQLASPNMSLLYGELELEDSGQIVSRLDQLGVPYELRGGGSQVFVGADQVDRMRLALAEDGLPSGGSIGYEIFDRSASLGTTNFIQNINHLRALEGELGRTIAEIRSVRSARVHLVLPKRELFSRERTEPTASIVVKLAGGRQLSKGQIAAIRSLVAAAVPDLSPQGISIIDDRGTLLARGSAGDDDDQLTASTSEEMRQQYELRLQRTIEELLSRVVGPGKVKATVAAEIELDRVSSTSEIYDPDGQVVRSTQIVEETSANSDAEGDDPVSVDENLPEALDSDAAGGSQSSSQTSRTEETVNFEISKTVKSEVRESGLVRRLSIAVLVDGTYEIDEEENATYSPRTEEELQRLEALIRSAVGFDEARGDTIELANMRFITPEESGGFNELPLILGFEKRDLFRMAEIGVLGMVAMLVLLMVVRPLMRKALEAGPLPVGAILAGAGGGEALLAGQTMGADGTPQLAGPDGGEGQVRAIGPDGEPVEEEEEEDEAMIDLAQIEGRVKASSVRKIGELIEKHPDEAVAIVRNWMSREN